MDNQRNWEPPNFIPEMMEFELHIIGEEEEEYIVVVDVLAPSPKASVTVRIFC